MKTRQILQGVFLFLGFVCVETIQAQSDCGWERDAQKIIVNPSASEYVKGFCTGTTILPTAEQINSVYSALNVSKDEFVRDYQLVESVVCHGKDGSVQTLHSSMDFDNHVSYSPNDAESGLTTSGLIWSISPKYRREHQGECPKATAIFVKNLGAMVQDIVVLNLESDKPLPTYLPSSDYCLPNLIEAYWKSDEAWNGGENVAQINVYVPSIGETNDQKAIISKDLQELFSEELCSGVRKNISSDYKKGNNNVIDNAVSLVVKSAKCGKYNLSVSKDRKGLLCQGELVATLDGTVMTINKESKMARELVNTNQLYITFSYIATYTTPCTGEVEIPHDSYPEFTVRCVRPMNAMKPDEGYFVDGLDFGTFDFDTYMTSLLRVSDMVTITDWRGQKVEKGSYLWDYYGIKRITCDNSQVLTDITGDVALLSEFTNSANKQVLKAGIVNGEAWADDELNGGLAYAAGKMGLSEEETYDQFFYYKNNGATVFSRFHLYFPIIVDYTWGTISNSVLEVSVLPTMEATGLADQITNRSEHTYYDLHGRKVKSPQTSGVYLSKGKKILIVR